MANQLRANEKRKLTYVSGECKAPEVTVIL